MTSIMVWCLVMAIISVLFSLVTGVFAFLSYSKVVGMEKSTHQVQWVPMDGTNPTGKELGEKMAEAFDYYPEQDHI